MMKSLFVAVFLVSAAAAPNGGLRGVAMEEVASSLAEASEAVLRGGDGAMAEHLAGIEKRIWQTFEALPKNELGRLAPRAVRYLAHNYFAREHGWLIQGLEPHGHQEEVSEVHEMSILQDKAPAVVESLLEHQRAERGLSLSDMVAMIAVLERLIFDEALTLLQASYSLNELSPVLPLDETDIHEVLKSYLILFEMGQKANLTDAKLHKALKRKVSKGGKGNWPVLVEFEEDAVANFGYARKHEANPFVEPSYDFNAAVQIVEGLASGYGKWQHMECKQMKEDLMEMGDGSGRVPMGQFYSKSPNADYHFTESADYLREIGALDEGGAEPRVRIANYMSGPSNCIASSTYYSVCCLNECEAVVNELEAKLHSPTADPQRLLELVGNMSSDTVEAPRQLSPAMAEKLESIAARNGGDVPVHGRLFAQWLHHAFPNECPYPAIAENAAVLTPSHWLDKTSTASEAEKAEMTSKPFTEEAAPPEMTWSDEEHLAAQEPSKKRGLLAAGLRAAMQLVMLLGLFRAALASWHSLSSAQGGKKAAVDMQLPF
mmetsp:Transcript_40418/g.72622  ORF Transcript_40418/g.72622 Transcript_40418/m.72622 type:complete len:546 (+) Transcript_40418:158-1795(+)